MIPRPTKTTRTDTLFPDRTLIRSHNGKNKLIAQFQHKNQVFSSETLKIRSLWNCKKRDICECKETVESWVEEEFQRSEEHTSELKSLMRSSYAVFCMKIKNTSKIYCNITKKQTKLNKRGHKH